MLAAKHRVYEAKHTQKVGLFAGILRCKDCDAPLAYSTKYLANSTKGIYRCSTYNNKDGSKACTNHYIHEADVAEYVLNDIKRYAVLSVTERESLEKRLVSYMRKTQDNDAKGVKSRIRESENRLQFIANTLKSLYEDKVSGELSKEMFQTFMTDYNKEQAGIEETLPRLRRELESIQEATGEISEWLSVIERCLNLEELDRETVIGLIDKIIVSERVKVDGRTTQELDIRYRFIGNLLQNAKEDATV